MKKRIISTVTCMVMVVMLSACGNDENIPSEPAATETVAETTASEETPTPAASEEETPEPTETSESTEAPEATPEATEEPAEEISFSVNKLKKVLKRCIGIQGTAGSSLKYAAAAEGCLGYAVKNRLSRPEVSESSAFQDAMNEAVGSFSSAEQDELHIEMTENIMPMITDSFQEQGLYDGELEDAGVLEAWNKHMAKPTVRADWSAFWIAYETVAE